jgi:hypothetical protein
MNKANELEELAKKTTIGSVELESVPTQAIRFSDPQINCRVFGGPFRARTGDPLIKSQLLYQLS